MRTGRRELEDAFGQGAGAPGKADRPRWGKLTDNDLQTIAGQRDQLIGRIQVSCGVAKEEAENQVTEFERSLDDARNAARH